MEERHVVMIKFGELFLKSEPVMRHYIGILTGNLTKALDAAAIDHTIEVYRGRILVEGPDIEGISRTAARLFGVVGVARCIRTEPDREQIETAAAKLAARTMKEGMSFAVRARRSGMKGFTSQELGASTGARIFDAVPGITVDLTNPDYEVHVEAREFGGLVYDAILPAPGGLPLGTQGHVLSLLSAGIDSPVATWLMMRRGCIPTLIHMDGGKYAGEQVKPGALRHLETLSTWCPGRTLRLISVPMEAFFDAMVASGATRTRCLLCKRFMVRVAAEIARRQQHLAIVMGDNIGQVASQTLANMSVIEAVAPQELPILRPLITYDKDEIVTLARSIGTFRESAGDLECRVVPKHPAIAAQPATVLEDEAPLDIASLVETAIEHVTIHAARNGSLIERDE
ncbi:tRNA uracil 4-sulfurtransferase ThiI [Methanovulcanius yangii]|uniref:tRNA uracil 4-sulfurtransferase ThiI n=1 Tax=Methanovulcanius yangii TaxID=1789227 RepID=UPI0029CA89EE|nr:tRNA uracil 4-sulfurtransferase ThiI [Methanovulcanius yangii]